jgi:hypothetical protein
VLAVAKKFKQKLDEALGSAAPAHPTFDAQFSIQGRDEGYLIAGTNPVEDFEPAKVVLVGLKKPEEINKSYAFLSHTPDMSVLYFTRINPAKHAEWYAAEEKAGRQPVGNELVQYFPNVQSWEAFKAEMGYE